MTDAPTLDQPLRLSAAAKAAFPDGSMTVSGLRYEESAGRLNTFMVAGKVFTTLGDINRMIEKCREERKARASGSNQPERRAKASPPKPQSGASETEIGSSPLEQARARLQKLRKPSASISTSKRSREFEVVTLVPSQSRK